MSRSAAGAADLVGSALAVLTRCLRWSLTIAIAVMLACIALQVVMRYAFGRTPSWSEELAILMFAWATLGGFALGVREGFHVRLTMMVDWLPRRAHMVFERGTDAISAVLGGYLFWSGWRYVEVTRGSRSAAIQYPIELLHGLAAVAGALVFLFALERLIRGQRAAVPGPEAGPVLP